MMTILQTIFTKLPAHWWCKSIRGFLSISFSFYMLGISSNGLFERYLALFLNSLFIRFVFFYLLSLLIFYVLADLFLRWIAYKIIKRWIEKKLTEQVFLNAKFDILRAVTAFRNVSVAFLTGLPVQYGYINRSDIAAIPNHLQEVDRVEVSEQEKENTINEIINGVNKWLCVLIHLIFTSFVIWHFNQPLMIIIIILGFLITILLYFALIIVIKNIEFINVVLKSFTKLKVR